MIVHSNSFRIPMKDNSVHAVCTSFPYWGLRSYNLPDIIIGGVADCRHEWGNISLQKTQNNNGLQGSTLTSGASLERRQDWSDGKSGQSESALCSLCGAFFGSFGLEPTMALHIRNAVLVCREIKRVLRKDGVFFLNYGDSYATSRNGRSADETKANGKDDRTFRDKPFSTTSTGSKRYRLRQDLTAEQMAYVLQELATFRQVKKVSSPDDPAGIDETIATLTGSK